ncbi:MAG: ABC transporter permease [Acidobacteriia bacterium]|nr:ABC transporter permease [Terriglobia bacterium]
MIHDLRYALRMLQRNPGFALVAIVSLALGIGANTAIFSLADYVLVRPLAVPNPSAIMVVQSQFRGESLGNIFQYSGLSNPDFEDLRKKSNSFAGLTASQYFQFGFAPDKAAQPQMKFGALVSGNFFDVLGVRPDLGRSFRPDEDKVPGRDAVVVLGHDLWETEFASNPDVVGRSIFLNGLPFTVVGVAPESFTGSDAFIRADLYVPLAMERALAEGSEQSELEMRGLKVLTVLGRLKPGVRVRQAAAETRVIGQQLAQAYPKTNRTCSLEVMTYRQSQMIKPIVKLVLFLLGLAVVVLLIACANVMNLMLSRASARAREIAVRLAMGAGRVRLIRQLLTESLVIAVLGGALGLLLAQAGANWFSQIRIPIDVPLVIDVKLDPHVLLFVLLVSVASAVLFGLAPALQGTQTDLVPALKAGGAAPGKRRRFLGRNALVMAQVAGSLLLLVIATQAYRGAMIILSSPAGFRTDHILMASFNPALARDSTEQTKEFYRRLQEQARTLSGLKSAALAQAMPMVPASPAIRVIPEGVQLPTGTEAVSVFSNTVSDGYFRTLGVPLVEGREFESTDRADSERVVIVNEQFAHKYYPNQDAIGKRLRLNSAEGPFAEIVGVAKQSKYVFTIEPPMEYIYLPLAQNPAAAMTLMLESEGPSAGLSGPLRDLVRSLDSRQPIYGVRTMEEFFDVRAHKTLGLFVEAIAGLGVLGLVLALVGLYGLMTYSVSLRQREIGIRMAVGADPATVVGMVLRQGMILAGSGVIVGLSLSLAASKPLAAMVHGRGFSLPLVALVTIALLAMAALGAYIPARRASRVDPNTVLRQE